MIRRTALLSALTLSLLLAACSKQNNDEAALAKEAQATAVSEEQAGTEAPAEAPPPKMDYWKALGPFLAGNYGGACMRTADGRKMDAAITLGADGRASSNGLDVDFRAAKSVMLARSRDDKGQFSTMVLLSVDDNKAGMLTLNTGGPLKESTASLARDDLGLMCSNVAGIERLNAKPVYQALPQLLDGKKQTIGCLDTKDLLVRRDTEVQVVDGVVRIGDTSFDLKDAVSEGFNFDDAGRSMTLVAVMPGERGINIAYDGGGKLTSVTVTKGLERTHSCSVQG